MPNELEQKARELWIAEHRHDAGRVVAIKAGLLTADDRRALRAIAAALQARQPGAQAVAAHAYMQPETLNSCDPVRFEQCRREYPDTYADWYPVYTHPQPPSIPEPSEDDAKSAMDAFDKAVRAMPAMVPADPSAKWTTGLMLAALADFAARLRERIGGGV